MKAIKLSNSEYENIKNTKKNIGSGVDGSIYRIDKDTIFKFYHKVNNIINIPNVTLDDDGVNISDFKSLRPYNKVKNTENILYRDSDGVILTREDAIYKAMEKQKNVKLTALPKNIIYVKKKIVGCEYKYYPNRLGIYASAYLPLKQRLVICKRLLEKVKELLDNNIYPVTLAQRNPNVPFKRDGSNVLIGLDLDPVIIDLDGISALYSDSFSSKFYTKASSTLSTLILELITRVKLANYCDDDYVVQENIKMMEEAGISSDLAEKYLDYNGLDMEDLDLLMKTLEKRKK